MPDADRPGDALAVMQLSLFTGAPGSQILCSTTYGCLQSPRPIQEPVQRQTGLQLWLEMPRVCCAGQPFLSSSESLSGCLGSNWPIKNF